MDKTFFHKYFYKFSGLIKYQIKYSDELFKISKLLVNLKKEIIDLLYLVMAEAQQLHHTQQ